MKKDNKANKTFSIQELIDIEVTKNNKKWEAKIEELREQFPNSHPIQKEIDKICSNNCPRSEGSIPVKRITNSEDTPRRKENLR